MFQRQQSEAVQSRAILQSLSDGVIVCGDDGSVLTANLAVERILERSIEELVIWNLPELLRRLLGRRADEVPIDELLARPTDERHAPRTFSTTFEMNTRMISVTLGPVLNSKEALLGVVAVFRDITREVESDRLKTEFIGTVSHELHADDLDQSFTQLLAMGSLGPVNDTQKSSCRSFKANAERMITIINDLLDITKIETGSVELDLRPLHLAESLSNVMMELQPNIQAREHALSIAFRRAAAGARRCATAQSDLDQSAFERREVYAARRQDRAGGARGRHRRCAGTAARGPEADRALCAGGGARYRRGRGT